MTTYQTRAAAWSHVMTVVVMISLNRVTSAGRSQSALNLERQA